MLIGLFGYLDGYNGSFAFEKPGDKYEDYPYMGMRIVTTLVIISNSINIDLINQCLYQGCTLMGAMLVPFSFLTVWEMTFSLPAATYAGVLILLGTFI